MTDERHKSHGTKEGRKGGIDGAEPRTIKKREREGALKSAIIKQGEGKRKKYGMSNLPLPPITMRHVRLITAA